MNLTDSEKKTIQTAINAEIEKLLREQRNFKLSLANANFAKEAQ